MQGFNLAFTAEIDISGLVRETELAQYHPPNNTARYSERLGAVMLSVLRVLRRASMGCLRFANASQAASTAPSAASLQLQKNIVLRQNLGPLRYYL